MARTRAVTFARQMLLVQLAVVVAVVVLTTVTYGVLATISTREDAQQTALAIARSTAANAGLSEAVAAESADPATGGSAQLAAGPVQSIAEAVRARTSALFVVVTDDRGLRLAHPNPALLGERVSTDPTAALGGQESTSWESGTLGDSARAKVPVTAADGRVVGEVSVGIPAASVFEASTSDVAVIAVVAAIALAIGGLAATLLSRRLRRQTLGLQPAELAGMVLDQSAVISGIGEGVVGITAAGVVSVCNSRASALLGVTDAVGRDIADLALPGELMRAVDDRLRPRGAWATGRGAGAADRAAAQGAADRAGDADPASLRFAVDDRLLYVDVARVTRSDVELGVVVVLRDETDLASMTHRLEAVEASSRALRVQRHEFANRLHVISGLVSTGRSDDASSYLAGILEHGPVNFPVEKAELLTEPYLQAFLGAKSIEAAERGVTVQIGPETAVSSALSRPEEVTTVLGNLFDNAVSAAALGSREPRWVQVEALDDGPDLHLAVSDSGDGVGEEGVRMLFRPRSALGAPGASTQSGATASAGSAASGSARTGAAEHPEPAFDRVHGLGVGLTLSRDIARRDGGDLWLASASSRNAGAVFCARLVNVLSSDPAADPETRDLSTGRPAASDPAKGLPTP
ncbi:sensor histidine kinase [Subtercola boreus]|uniref:histidine kinase n=1 Tax=Subtercola boreus TaxID=120213 RepID=A0A3E0WF55_9MICO|nr:ATP-binding protein [Subtercola boreus]RFA22723.1 histidine kinase [Subtercola boreus]RFA23078.1 histidine kinase [Subtercola boreus]RFA28831.1 histidine kinase [Subtercola boreus]